MRAFFCLLILLLFYSPFVNAQNLTSVHGIVQDSLSGERLAYATIAFDGVGVGARTDINGNFYIETAESPRKLRVSYVGYKAQILSITPGRHNELVVKMVEHNSDLREVTIKPKKYSRKNNPAVDLVEEVFKHKDQNRKEGLDYYSFEKYEKLQMDLNNITDGFRRKWYFRPFRFIFNNVDTNVVTQKVALPIYLRERVLNAYYRKEPYGQKAILKGERLSGFVDENQEEDGLGVDAEGVSAYLNSSFADVDIYEPKIQLLGTEFVGPLSGIANTMYRFYIIDTVEFNGKQFVDLFFAPKNKADLAFMGNMLVALDSTYAVMKVEMGVPKEINLNFVSDLRIEQVFERLDSMPDSRLMLTYDAVTVDLKVLKNKQGRSLLTHKSSWFRNYTMNQPLPDSLFKGQQLLVKDTGAIRKRPEHWWNTRRQDPLTRAQQFVDKMVDSMQQVRAYKLMVGTGKLLGTGYQRIGFVDVGMVSNLYSYNDVEGGRIRMGARTNSRLYKPLVLEGYGAYGLRDLRWKYQAGATYSFNGKVPRAFPRNQLSVSWQKDLRIPGLSLDKIDQDNTILSFQRASRDKMLFNTVLKLEYKREYNNQFSYSLVALRKVFDSAGVLSFEVSGSDPENPQYAPPLNTAEVGVYMRYAPNQQFYNGANYRTAIPSKFPIFSMTFKNGFDNIVTGSYSFQKINLTAEKRFFVAPFGYSDWTLNAGRVWGQVPYPLLEIHPANQSYFYDWYAFNLMNFMEFVSDKYVTLNVQHNFNGLVFNKIPLLKKLQWRENFSFKGIYGGLDDRNNPALTAGLFKFPQDAAGNTITHTLSSKPYMEMSVGIGNLFHFLRVDYVWRLSYTDLPTATKWGVRVMFGPKF